MLMKLIINIRGFRQLNEHQLPRLKSLAKRSLCTPATSVPSESAFSVASNLVSGCYQHDHLILWYYVFQGRQQRARLLPSTLAMSVFLKDKVNDDED